MQRRAHRLKPIAAVPAAGSAPHSASARVGLILVQGLPGGGGACHPAEQRAQEPSGSGSQEKALLIEHGIW